MKQILRVVFDCNVFLQALAAPDGPAGQCVQLALEKKIDLAISPSTVEELKDVTSRPRVVARMRLVPQRVEELLTAVQLVSTIFADYPDVFQYPRDPDDADYVNLAIAASAGHIVSRDKDLLDLMDKSKPDAANFANRFPGLRIVDPVQFLAELNLKKHTA